MFSFREALGRMDKSCVCHRSMKNKKTPGTLWDIEPIKLHFIQICVLLVISLWILQCLAKGDPFGIIFLFTPKPLKDTGLLEVPIFLIWDLPFLYKKRSEEAMWLFIGVAAFPPWTWSWLQTSTLSNLSLFKLDLYYTYFCNLTTSVLDCGELTSNVLIVL